MTWYGKTESAIGKHGRVPLLVGLGFVVAVSAFFFWQVAYRKKYELPASGWLAWMLL